MLLICSSAGLIHCQFGLAVFDKICWQVDAPINDVVMSCKPVHCCDLGLQRLTSMYRSTFVTHVIALEESTMMGY
jgi:hypothetical protein